MHASSWILRLACAAALLSMAPQEPEGKSARHSATVEGAFVDARGAPVGGVRVLRDLSVEAWSQGVRLDQR
jgi:hypothetical protein